MVDGSAAEFLRVFQSIVDELRTATRSDRVTLRLENAALGLKLERVAVESLADGVNSIMTLTTADIRNGSAPRWLIANRRTFVMDDCLRPSDPALAPEDYVIETYRVRSEMVSPVFADQELVGIISVHYTQGPRHWTTAELELIEDACEEVKTVRGRC